MPVGNLMPSSTDAEHAGLTSTRVLSQSKPDSLTTHRDQRAAAGGLRVSNSRTKQPEITVLSWDVRRCPFALVCLARLTLLPHGVSTREQR